MLKSLLIPAILTGVFCAGFAVGISYVTEMLARGQVAGISFVSGVLGNLFARLALGWRG